MKIDIKTMLLTFGVCLLFAFTSGDIFTFKPAIPKEVFADRYIFETSVIPDIKKYTKLGYIVKTIETTSAGNTFLVMEKY